MTTHQPKTMSFRYALIVLVFVLTALFVLQGFIIDLAFFHSAGLWSWFQQWLGHANAVAFLLVAVHGIFMLAAFVFCYYF